MRDQHGPRHPQWKGGRKFDSHGYVSLWMPDHPLANANGRVAEHLVIVSKALGYPLPKKHPVHHFNEIKSDNANANLVICENQKYHELLHARQRVKHWGGDPDTQKICCNCKQLLSKLEFSPNFKRFDDLNPECRGCCRVRDRIRRGYKTVRGPYRLKEKS